MLGDKRQKFFAIAIIALILTACDFQGPWEYYPHKKDVYGGIYTYGHIVEGENPRVCFSKMYALDETSAEDFAFYDYAYVTVSGKFEGTDSITVKLNPLWSRSNCFFPNNMFHGIAGETYTLNATFDWDSAGEKVTSHFKAQATIPTGFAMKKFCIPQKDGSCKQMKNNHKRIETEGLEFPNDMNMYKFSPNYNESVDGVLLALSYDNNYGGETMNSTLNKMLSGFVSKDSLGYTGLHVRNPQENYAQIGYYENVRVGGYSNLDSMMLPSMNIPLGDVTIYFFAADSAYDKYDLFVLGSADDSRIQQQSNIEGGMGVFTGMQKDSLFLKITLGDFTPYQDYIPYYYMKLDGCLEKDADGNTWSKDRFCRLHEYEFCKKFHLINSCYSYNVYSAMQIGYSEWDALLPSDISEKEKKEAYEEGLKSFCFESNFESNSLADCSQLKKDCMESTEKTDCMEKMWEWCADRQWEDFYYTYCGRALVSRYYLEEIKSSVIEKYVEKWCEQNPLDKFCK